MAKTKDERLKCSTELVAEISRRLLAGASMKSTAGSVGIDYSTLKRWLAWEREGKEPFATLCAPLKRARHKAIANAEQRIYEGKTGWQAAARWLESINPEQWRRTQRREVSQTQDIRFSWPDLAKSGPGMAARRAAAVDEALRKAQEEN